MRVIPVVDLQGGMAVHAVRGERSQYRPVAGAFGQPGDALALARDWRTRLALSELYVADLDAIQGHGENRALVATLAAGAEVMLDAGIATAEQARAVLATGAAQVIAGLETLAGRDQLAALPRALPPDRLVFSLDMRDGAPLARDPALAALDPLALLDLLAVSGWRTVILLDLARVGSGAGIDLDLISAAHARQPGLALLAGGGVRGLADLQALRAAGAAGALVATALHNGALGPSGLVTLRE